MTPDLKPIQDVLQDESIKVEDAALVFLRAAFDLRVNVDGGYPAVIDDTTFDGYIVVSDVEEDEPQLKIYRREKINNLAHEAMTEGCLDDEGEKLPPDEVVDAAMDFFHEGLADCEVNS